jgi:hypothetical protein
LKKKVFIKLFFLTNLGIFKMKKLFGIIVLAFILSPMLSFSTILGGHNVINQSWTACHMEEPVNKCYGEGNCCWVIVNTEPYRIPGSVTNVNPGGRMLEFTFSSISEYCTPNSGDPFYTEGVSNALYTFREGTTFRIDESDDDASLIGLEFNIGGYTTNANGKIQLYVPY